MQRVDGSKECREKNNGVLLSPSLLTFQVWRDRFLSRRVGIRSRPSKWVVLYWILGGLVCLLVMDMDKCSWGLLGREMVPLVIPSDGYGQMSLRPFGKNNGPSSPHRFRFQYNIDIYVFGCP